ncbi:MAG: efflux RND transporter periplasmic adaptor subunit [Treponema sp.]|nr:efflux RND transporter periplasmic adaptor subunit [Treponema sp.]
MDFEKTTGTPETTEADETGEAKKGRGKIILALVLTLTAGAGIGSYAIWQGAQYLSTDNARVTTTLIAVMPPVPGILERFTAYEGRYVEENEILGWVENSEAMRSPVEGLVIHTNAVQNQVVSPAEPVAVIACTASIHIQANIEETGIARIQAGQSVIVTIDTFPGRRFSGYVREIGHITQAELSGNALFFNTGGTFTRVTHLIPVKINIVDDIALDSFIGVNARVRFPLRQPAPSHARPAALTDGITVRGAVESVYSRNIYSTLVSMIERIYVEAGDRVTEGQVLGVLDTVDFNIQRLNAEASLRIAEVNLAAAEHSHETLSVLYGAQAIARNDLLQSEFALQSAIASRQQAQALLDTVDAALQRSVITSPINGTVTAVIAREGEVGLGRLFIVEDTDTLKITTGFREYDLGRILAGMEVTIVPEAAGSAEYSGVITRINPAARSFAPVVEFEAEVLVTSERTSLRIGMNTRLTVRPE